MGVLYSRTNERIETMDLTRANYRYPPKSGNYFSSHFIMGDQTFSGTQPESFLFGDNSDLNFLAPRPVAFPYPEAHKSEPTKLLRCLINLRKDSLRLVKHEEVDTESDAYYIDFVFDTDIKCAVNIHYLATEDMSSGRAVYTTKDKSLTSRSFTFDKGANQLFTHGKFHLIKPCQFKESELIYSENSNQIPVVIHITAVEDDFAGHSHITMANIEMLSDGSYTIKLLKQKQMVDGLCYLLHEIYGLESKEESEHEEEKAEEDYDDDDCYGDSYSDENVVCVVCMSAARDTLMLPCKHLCVCSDCAENLRRGSNNCPICRVPFHALLQLCAYQRANSTNNANYDSQFPGYKKVDLFDALNAYNIGKGTTPSSREIVRRVSARTVSKSRPSTPKPSQKSTAEERTILRSSSRFSRSSRGSRKRELSDITNDPPDSVSRASFGRSRKGSSKSHVVEVEDRTCIVKVEKDSSVEPVQGLEVGVEVGQDNLGMDNVKEETAHINEDPGYAIVEEVDTTSQDRSPEAPNRLNVPLPGTPLNNDISDVALAGDAEAPLHASSTDIISDEPKNGESFVV